MIEPGAMLSPRLWPNPWKGNDMAKGSWGMCWRTFERLVLIETDECVLWPHGTSHGYATLRHNGAHLKGHVLALERHVGPCPPGMEACHAPGIGCQRRCINYRHLRWDTRTGNMADQHIDETSLRGVRSPRAKLTEQDVRGIRTSAASTKEIAAEYGINKSHVWRIRNSVQWNHLGDH